MYASLWERYEGEALAAEFGKPSRKVQAGEIVESAARRARKCRPELEVAAEVVAEEPEYVLLRESRRATAVVVGTRGRSGLTEALLGSVSLTVAAQAYCPVIVVRGGADRAEQTRRGRIVVGVGDDPKESPAVRFAYDEARLRGVSLDAVRAWRSPAHENTDHPLLVGGLAHPHESRAAQALEAVLHDAPDGIELHRHTVEGPARKVLSQASRRADLLVVGAKRRHGHLGLQLGRVAHALLHLADCPVAVVPQAE